MSSSVTRTKEGVPGWSGEPSSWAEYKTAARLYVASTKYEARYTCGPRLAAELSGAAKTAIMGQRSTWLSEPNGAEKLLKHLQQTIGEPALPEVGNFMRQYFRVLRRRRGETMTAFCVRHREEYDKMCRALGRMIKEQSGSGSAAIMLGRTSSGTSGARSDEGSVPSNPGDRVTEQETEGPEPSSQQIPAWANEPWRGHWGGWHYQWNWWGANWPSNWSSSDWSGSQKWWAQHHQDDEEEDQLIQVLPDAVQGWFLLEKCNLDPLERSVIQGDLRSNFTLAGVENALRSHWTDEQIKKRDGEPRGHQANYQDQEDDVSEPEQDPDDAFFEEMSEQERALWQEMRGEEQHAWVQFQQARRTLREARARQHEVKMGRMFYRKGGGKGKPGPIGGNPRQQGPCLRCGGKHNTNECPGNGGTAKAAYVEAPEHLAEYTYYHEGEGEALEVTFAAWESTALTTAEAVKRGCAVIDPGATKTMASLHAVQQLVEAYEKSHGATNVVKVNTEERPTFGFGNSEQSRCISTAYLKVPKDQDHLQLRVHIIGEGTAPVLLSIESLRRLGAIIDYKNNLAVFTSLDAARLVRLHQSQAGHQLLSLGEDLFKSSVPLKRAVSSLQDLE